MKVNPQLFVVGVLAAIALSTAAAHAAPIVVLDGGTFATEVDNLEVDGRFYNVTFGVTVDQTFQGNPSGALDAANGLLAALNASAAVNVEIPGVLTADGFTIADNGSSGEGLQNGTATQGLWSVVFGSGLPFAEFAAVPEPTTLALLTAGLVPLGAARRRGRKQ